MFYVERLVSKIQSPVVKDLAENQLKSDSDCNEILALIAESSQECVDNRLEAALGIQDQELRDSLLLKITQSVPRNDSNIDKHIDIITYIRTKTDEKDSIFIEIAKDPTLNIYSHIKAACCIVDPEKKEEVFFIISQDPGMSFHDLSCIISSYIKDKNKQDDLWLIAAKNPKFSWNVRKEAALGIKNIQKRDQACILLAQESDISYDDFIYIFGKIQNASKKYEILTETISSEVFIIETLFRIGYIIYEHIEDENKQDDLWLIAAKNPKFSWKVRQKAALRIKNGS